MKKKGKMKVFAFDRDRTVETSQGLVPLSLIKKLKEKHIVYAIGNQALVREAGILPRPSGGDKVANLKMIREKHPSAEEYIVVDDAELCVDGWTYLSPHAFLKLFEEV